MVQPVIEYHENYNLTLDFAQTLARFEGPKDLATVSALKAMYSKPNFPQLMKVLDPVELHEIHVFKRATQSYIENNSPAVREQIKAQLSGAKLSQWEGLANVILAKSVFQPGPACAKKLKAALDTFETLAELQPITAYKEQVNTLYEQAFSLLTAHRAFAKWDWQTELTAANLPLPAQLRHQHPGGPSGHRLRQESPGPAQR